MKKLKPEDKAQKTLLLTLMTELKLYKQNTIENSSEFKANDEVSRFAREAYFLKFFSVLKKKYSRLKEADKDLSDFLSANINDLDEVEY